jgi:hypothetical protein
MMIVHRRRTCVIYALARMKAGGLPLAVTLQATHTSEAYRVRLRVR